MKFFQFCLLLILFGLWRLNTIFEQYFKGQTYEQRPNSNWIFCKYNMENLHAQTHLFNFSTSNKNNVNVFSCNNIHSNFDFGYCDQTAAILISKTKLSQFKLTLCKHWIRISQNNSFSYRDYVSFKITKIFLWVIEYRIIFEFTKSVKWFYFQGLLKQSLW